MENKKSKLPIVLTIIIMILVISVIILLVILFNKDNQAKNTNAQVNVENTKNTDISNEIKSDGKNIAEGLVDYIKNLSETTKTEDINTEVNDIKNSSTKNNTEKNNDQNTINNNKNEQSNITKTDEEIVREQFLEYLKKLQNESKEKILDYRIDSVTIITGDDKEAILDMDQGQYYKKTDVLFSVKYSLKPEDPENSTLNAGKGAEDVNGWFNLYLCGNLRNGKIQELGTGW